MEINKQKNEILEYLRTCTNLKSEDRNGSMDLKEIIILGGKTGNNFGPNMNKWKTIGHSDNSISS